MPKIIKSVFSGGLITIEKQSRCSSGYMSMAHKRRYIKRSFDLLRAFNVLSYPKIYKSSPMSFVYF